MNTYAFQDNHGSDHKKIERDAETLINDISNPCMKITEIPYKNRPGSYKIYEPQTDKKNELDW